MKSCPLCQQTFETGAGLASHRRAKHGRWKGPNRKAIDKALIGRDDVDDPTRQMLRSIADTLDFDPTNAQMWKTYRDLVRELVGDGNADDETEDEIEAIRSRAQVGHLKAL